MKFDNEFFKNGFFLLAAYSVICSGLLFQKTIKANKLAREKAQVSAQVESVKLMLSMLEIKTGVKLETMEENKQFSVE